MWWLSAQERISLAAEDETAMQGRLCSVILLLHRLPPLWWQHHKWELDEIRSAKKINALIFHSETDGEIDYQSDSRYLKWMADIPGAKWIELPNHNSEDGKEIIIDGKQCKIKKRMRGGWKIKHNQDLGHKKKAWTIVDPNEKKEMMKKASGHYIPYRSCFTPYLDDIEKFIESKI